MVPLATHNVSQETRNPLFDMKTELVRLTLRETWLGKPADQVRSRMTKLKYLFSVAEYWQPRLLLTLCLYRTSFIDCSSYGSLYLLLAVTCSFPCIQSLLDSYWAFAIYLLLTLHEPDQIHIPETRSRYSTPVRCISYYGFFPRCLWRSELHWYLATRHMPATTLQTCAVDRIRMSHTLVLTTVLSCGIVPMAIPILVTSKPVPLWWQTHRLTAIEI